MVGTLQSAVETPLALRRDTPFLGTPRGFAPTQPLTNSAARCGGPESSMLAGGGEVAEGGEDTPGGGEAPLRALGLLK